MIGKNGYENDDKLLSYPASIYIKNSERGVGKSYGRKWKFIKRYKQYNERFVCLYRTKNDRDAAISSWTEQFIRPSANDPHEPISASRFKWKKGKNCVELYLDEDKVPIGWFLVIAHVNAIKQMIFNEQIAWVWLDEYLPEAWQKLPGIDNEGMAIMKIINTIDHDSRHRTLKNGYPRVRTILYGNFSNLQSPLLQFFGVSPFKYGIYRGSINGEATKDVMIETCMPVLEDKFGDYSNVARRCMLDTEEKNYVCNKPPEAPLLYSLRIKQNNENHYFHFYRGNTCYWINQGTKHKGNTRRGSVNGKRPDEQTLFETSTNPWKKRYLHLFSLGYLYFATPYVKLNFMSDIT